MNRKELSMEKSMAELSDDVLADFQELVADMEALLKATANQGGEKLAEVRTRAEETLGVVKARLVEAQSTLLLKTRAAAKATDAYAHENPWQAVGVAAAFGVVIGLLIGRR